MQNYQSQHLVSTITQGTDLLETNLVKDIGWFKSMRNCNYVKLVPCILYICTAFTDATLFLFPLSLSAFYLHLLP